MVENKVMSLKEVYEKWKERDLDYILTNLEDFGSVHECINDLWLAVKAAVERKCAIIELHGGRQCLIISGCVLAIEGDICHDEHYGRIWTYKELQEVADTINKEGQAMSINTHQASGDVKWYAELEEITVSGRDEKEALSNLGNKLSMKIEAINHKRDAIISREYKGGER